MYAICLGEDVFAAMDGRLRAHFPSMAYFPAVDCRLGLRTAADFARLRFPVTNAVMFNILLGRSQKQNQDIVTPGPVGVAQSHLSIWADNAGRAGWIIVFESDAAVDSSFGADIADIVHTPMVEPFPGIFKFGHVKQIAFSATIVQPGLCKVSGGFHAGMHAYAIRRDVAAMYASLATPIGSHIDAEVTDLAAVQASLPLWATRANVCFQNKTGRDIIHPPRSLRLLLPEGSLSCNALLAIPWILLLLLFIAVLVVGTSRVCIVSKK